MTLTTAEGALAWIRARAAADELENTSEPVFSRTTSAAGCGPSARTRRVSVPSSSVLASEGRRSAAAGRTGAASAGDRGGRGHRQGPCACSCGSGRVGDGGAGRFEGCGGDGRLDRRVGAGNSAGEGSGRSRAGAGAETTQLRRTVRGLGSCTSGREGPCCWLLPSPGPKCLRVGARFLDRGNVSSSASRTGPRPPSPGCRHRGLNRSHLAIPCRSTCYLSRCSAGSAQ
mmetsp:Transcript_15105/g.37036  ORF Transcript_15105/g.37036 Transcript_15105/m.37036 type:complete len:229 (+) Transcript_15105:1725-2411(+)